MFSGDNKQQKPYVTPKEEPTPEEVKSDAAATENA